MSEVDEYISKIQDPWQRETLQSIRETIARAAPSAEEVISYGMPAFRYKRKYLIGYCNFKDHLSVFPGAEVIGALSKKLDGFKTSKGTIQFTREQPLPAGMLEDIIAMRIADIEQH